MLRSSPFFFKKNSGPAGRVVSSNQVKNEFTNVETYNTRQESLKRTPLLLNFLENSCDLFLTLLLSL